MKKVVLFLLVFILSSCGKDVRLELNADNVLFVAVVSSYEEKVGGGYQVLGKLKITNRSDGDIAFSNKDFYFIIKGEGESRTYLDSVASHAVDLSSITIKKGAELTQNVYWVLPPVKSLASEQLALEWRN